MGHEGQIIPFTSPMAFAREVMYKIFLHSNHSQVWLATRDGQFFRVIVEHNPRQQAWPRQLTPVDERSHEVDPAPIMTIEEVDMEEVEDAMDLVDVHKFSMSQALRECGVPVVPRLPMPPLSAGRSGSED
jgi:hypothetical protein